MIPLPWLKPSMKSLASAWRGVGCAGIDLHGSLGVWWRVQCRGWMSQG